MEVLKNIIHKEIGSLPHSVKRIGGGYYADVYKFDYQNSEPIIVKVYKSAGVMQSEISQIELLGRHSLFPMPKVLFSHLANKEYDKDFIIMNYLEGENGGNIFYLSKAKRERLANQVIDNLIAFHSVKSPDGFGEVGSKKRYEVWNEYYKEKAATILDMALQLKNKGELSEYAYNIMQKAVTQFDKIFYLPITEACLIHGDYNMWNIMVNKQRCKVTAVIDPCGCMWADSEYDLYQLNNANGKHLHLFEVYARKKQLSENCLEKMAFYELFTEIEHYYKSGHPIKNMLVKKQTDKLNYYMEKLL
ncbi:MAG: aminoglycoside phosphotransferase family protein [Clostridia bacterium]|nr:aminoglycoside phosphotransferase family protein [Clostridia bacterium]